jgi:FkbM family methyltransferase
MALAAPAATGEFDSPTHTPAVQILRPWAGRVAPMTGDRGLEIFIVAPEGAWVRLLVDRREVAFTNVSRTGLVVGLEPGLRIIEAHVLQLAADTEQVLARDSVSVHACLCAPRADKDADRTGLVAASYLPALQNPYQPSQRYMHHEVLHLFGRWEGEAEEGYLIDWLGVRTRYAWDCIKNGGYYKFVPSRRLECESYDSLHADTAGRSPSRMPRIKGFLPPVDDEYPEYIDMLSSIARSRGKHYIIVEFGASYGTWGVRAIAALRRLYPQATYHMIAVESSQHRYKQMLQHAKANNIHNCTLLHGYITGSRERAELGEGGKGVARSRSPYAVGEPQPLTLTEVLADHHDVDYIDFDIQGAELDVFTEAESLKTLSDKVRAVHVGTHSPSIHEHIRAIMLGAGWVLELDLDHNPRMISCDSSVLPSRESQEQAGQEAKWSGGGDDGQGGIQGGAAEGFGESGANGDAYDWLQRDESCLTHTEQGPMYVRDGLLSFYNPNFGADYELPDIL